MTRTAFACENTNDGKLRAYTEAQAAAMCEQVGRMKSGTMKKGKRKLKGKDLKPFPCVATKSGKIHAKTKEAAEKFCKTLLNWKRKKAGKAPLQGLRRRRSR